MAKGISRAWFLVPAGLVLLVVWTVVSRRSGSLPRHSREGGQSAVVSLRAPQGGGRDAGPRLVERLVALGVDATLVEAADDRVRIEVRRVSDPREAVEAASSPRALSFHVVDESAQGTGAGEDSGPGFVHPWRPSVSRAEVRSLRGEAPPGTAPVVECVPNPDKKGPPLCAAWLARPALIEAADVADVHLSSDRRTEEPLVTLRFTEKGALALEDASRAAAGKMLAVVALGELQARPRIDGPLTGGAWTFSTRTGDTSRPAAIERAQRIAAAVKLPPLPPLEIDRVE